MQLVLDDHSSPEIIWMFRESKTDIPERLVQLLSPAIDRGRATLYEGVDCHEFLPRLAEAWMGEEFEQLRAGWAQRLALPYRKTPSEIVIAPDSAGGARRHQKINFNQDEKDHPPKVDFYVGRSDELTVLRDSSARVLYITGIGGQGKSALVAHYFSTMQAVGRFDYFVWRDCKEESERFERQLITIIVALSEGLVGAHELATQPIESVTDVFIQLTQGMRLLLVFDNVDHYVNLENQRLSGAAARFVDRFLKSNSECKVLFTCRPAIKNSTSEILSYRLEGISYEDAIELFRLRAAPAEEVSIRRAYDLTGGHAFWLDLLAAQLARRAHQIDLDHLLNSFYNDTTELPTATLLSIWKTLKERDHVVLQMLAETVKPTSMLQLSHYLGRRLRYNELVKAVRTLKAVNLLVIKPQDDNQELLELHPLVRTFVRNNFANVDRAGIINSILDVYRAFFGIYRADTAKELSLVALDHWLEGAELHISAHQYADALDCLYEVLSPIRRNGSPNEFIRVVKLLFQLDDWSLLSSAKRFDVVLSMYVHIQALAGQLEECSRALEQYLETIDEKSARYINYCDLKCYTHWANRDFLPAIKWGLEGVELKTGSGVDTQFDAGHNLALSQRDSGAIDPALRYFLRDKKLDEIIKPEPPVRSMGGAYYGNIGRCLHFMSQLEPALSCYKKSAILIEDIDQKEDKSNSAYIREWIGEVLVAKGEFKLGLGLLEEAKERWELLSPPSANRIGKMINQVTEGREYVRPPRDEIRRLFAQWLKEPFVT